MNFRQSRQSTKRRSGSRKFYIYCLFCFVFLFAFFSFSTLQPVFGVINQEGMTYLSNPGHKSAVRFVLFLGIEGTGHHFWQDLIKESPMFSHLEASGLHPQFTRKITRSLYRHKKSRWEGLWSSTCKWDTMDPSPNITSIHHDLVTTMQEMKTYAQKQSGDFKAPIMIPVNFLESGDDFGVMSYPSFLKPCRALSYPNLDVWYQACDAAGVLCQHVYIYRDPYSVIKSTTDNRSFNTEKLEAIHLYTTQLHVLHSQLLSFSDRLVGCWNYNSISSPIHWEQDIEPLLQFKEPKVFAEVLKRVYHHKKPLTEEDQRNIIPVDISHYMKSMVKLHDLVVRTCKTLKNIQR